MGDPTRSSLIVPPEAIFLSTVAMIGQSRQAAFQRDMAGHDFVASARELHTNTELTRIVHHLATRSTPTASCPRPTRPGLWARLPSCPHPEPSPSRAAGSEPVLGCTQGTRSAPRTWCVPWAGCRLLVVQRAPRRRSQHGLGRHPLRSRCWRRGWGWAGCVVPQQRGDSPQCAQIRRTSPRCALVPYGHRS